VLNGMGGEAGERRAPAAVRGRARRAAVARSCPDWCRFDPVPCVYAAGPIEPKQGCLASDGKQVWPRGQVDWGGMPGCGTRCADERR